MITYASITEKLMEKTSGAVEGVAEKATDAVFAHLAEKAAFMKADLIDTSQTLVLVGGTICVVLYVAGWEKGMKYTGIMFVGYVLLRAVLGGGDLR